MEQNPEFLILAREFRGWTQTQLAQETGIDQGSISKYEGGIKQIPKYDLKVLARALGVDISYFSRVGQRQGAESHEIFHRKRKTIKNSQLVRINAQLNSYRLDIERLLETADIDLEGLYEIPQHNPREFDGDIEEIAARVRATWKVPPGPIQNLMQRLEAAGCFIQAIDFETNLMDETVQWPERMYPVMLVNSFVPGDRLRYSMAHALGHLVMHHDPIPYDEMEREADQFAAAFLMPADDIIDNLKPASIEHFLQLKPAWKVSMQALIYRAKDLGVINQTRYTSLFQMLSRAGYRKIEPYPLKPEQPQLIGAILAYYQNELEWEKADIAKLLGLSEPEFKVRFYPRHLHILPPTPQEKDKNIKKDLLAG